MLGGEPLESVSTATTVRVKSGKTLRTDGPFAETREQLGGFYTIEAKDLDEAVAIAAKVRARRRLNRSAANHEARAGCDRPGMKSCQVTAWPGSNFCTR